MLSPDESLRQDELLAQMLANETFIAELRNHPEFGAYLPSSGQTRGASGGRHTLSRSASGRTSNAPQQASMGERLGKMGEAAKTKLSALATRFRRMTQRKQGYATLDGDGGAGTAQPLEAALLPSGSVSSGAAVRTPDDDGVEMGNM